MATPAVKPVTAGKNNANNAQNENSAVFPFIELNDILLIQSPLIRIVANDIIIVKKTINCVFIVIFVF